MGWGRERNWGQVRGCGIGWGMRWKMVWGREMGMGKRGIRDREDGVGWDGKGGGGSVKEEKCRWGRKMDYEQGGGVK